MYSMYSQDLQFSFNRNLDTDSSTVYQSSKGLLPSYQCLSCCWMVECLLFCECLFYHCSRAPAPLYEWCLNCNESSFICFPKEKKGAYSLCNEISSFAFKKRNKRPTPFAMKSLHLPSKNEIKGLLPLQWNLFICLQKKK